MIIPVTSIVAMSARIPAATMFGVQWYAILENQMPRNTVACKSFSIGASHAVGLRAPVCG